MCFDKATCIEETFGFSVVRSGSNLSGIKGIYEIDWNDFTAFDFELIYYLF